MTLPMLRALSWVLAASLLSGLLAGPVFAQDEKPDEALVQKLVADPNALAAALKHCDPSSLTQDRECMAAGEAQNRKFFGNGTVPYTPHKVDVFPTNPTVTPSPRKP